MIISANEFIKMTASDLSAEEAEKRFTAIESFIRKYTNNNFQLREIRCNSPIVNGVILFPHSCFEEGDTVQITGSALNNGLFIVEKTNENGMKLYGRLYDCDENIITKIYYPPDVVEGAINMLKWDLESRDKIGIQSEKISRHSVTYTDINESSVMGYPKALLGFLKPYMKGRF